MRQILEFNPRDYGTLLATDKIDASNGALISNNTAGKIPPDTHNRTILIGLGGTGIKTINYVKRNIVEKLQPSWNKYIAFLGIDADWNEFDNASCLLKSEGIITTEDGVEQRAQNYSLYPQAWRSFADHNKVLHLANMGGAGSGRTRLMGKMKIHDRKSGQNGVDQRIVQSLTNLKTNVLSTISDSGNGGSYEVYVIGSVSGGTCSGGFLEMPALIREALNVNNLRIHAMLYLPDTVTGLDPQHAAELEANGYASLKELNYYQGMNMRLGYGESWSYNEPAKPELKIDASRDFFTMPYLVGTPAGAAGNSCKIAMETIAEFFVSILGNVETSDGQPFLMDSFLNNAMQRIGNKERSPGNSEMEASDTAHEFPKRFGAIGFASAAAPQAIIKAYAVGKACVTAGLQPVSAAEKAAMLANGSTFIPFRDEKDYLGAAEGSQKAMELIKPLEDLLRTYQRAEYNFQAHMQQDAVTWKDIREGMYEGRGVDVQVENYVEAATSSAAMKRLQQDVQAAFGKFRQNIKEYVSQEGPAAFVNLFEGNFLIENGNAGTGIKALLIRARDDKNIRTGAAINWKPSVACKQELDAAKDRINKTTGGLFGTIGNAFTNRQQEEANAWVACYNNWVNTRVNEKRREQMLGANHYVDNTFLKPAAIMAEQLQAFGYVIARLAAAYQDHGAKLGNYNSFSTVADNVTEVNIAAVNPAAHNWLQQEANRVAKNIDGQRVRSALVDSFFEEPTAWLNIPDEAVRITATGVSLANEDLAIPARQMFDKCMQSSISVNMDVTIENLFNQVEERNVSYDVYASQIMAELDMKSKLLFNGNIDSNSKHMYIMYPHSLRQNNPAIVTAIETAAQNLHAGIGFYGTDYADSIMMYQLAAPFEVYRLNALENWERQYENKMSSNNGLHGYSPDKSTSVDKNGTVHYSEVTSWYDYPAIVYRKDPSQRDPVTGKISHEGEVRLEIDKLLNEARELGVLYSKQDKGSWSFYRVYCDKSITWTFDETLMRPDRSTGLLPVGMDLAKAVASQNDRDLDEISRVVELHYGGLMNEGHSSEEWAWTYAKRVLYAHRPMLIEIRETVEKFREWNKVVAAYNKEILKKWKPAKMIRMMQGHILYLDEEGFWNLEGSSIAVANTSAAGLSKLRRQFPEDAAVLDAGFSLFYLYNALLRHRDMKEDGMDRALAEAKEAISAYADPDVLDESFDYVDKKLKEETDLLVQLGGNLEDPDAKPLRRFVEKMAEQDIEGEELLRDICQFYKMAKLWKKV